MARSLSRTAPGPANHDATVCLAPPVVHDPEPLTGAFGRALMVLRRVASSPMSPLASRLCWHRLHVALFVSSARVAEIN
jgi:hypothetical protein